MGPLQQVSASLGAEPPRVRLDSHPAEVQPIRVPARQQRPVAVGQPVRVETAGLEQQVKAVVVEVDQVARNDRANSAPRKP